MQNIALIGCGLYGLSCYASYFLRHKLSNLKVCVDLLPEKDRIFKYLNQFSREDKPAVVFAQENEDDLNKFIADLKWHFNLDGVIISTPPENRFAYIQACLNNDLAILADKPLTAPVGISTSKSAVRQFISEYIETCNIYKRSKLLPFDIMVQRRFHPVFDFMKHKLEEVAEFTGCGLTHFQSTHADGQWRFPQEIIDIPYHGTNQGQGKISHSGYHFFDIASIFARDSWAICDKKFDSLFAYVTPTFPDDSFAGFGNDQYKKLFPEYEDVEDFNRKTYNHGEIDAIVNLTFSRRGKSLCSGTLNLLHNSFSGRHWFKPAENLYRENGRLRQELHYFVQGPFQSITMTSLRGCSKVPVEKRVADESERTPLEIHVFRNKGINQKWLAYEKVTLDHLIPDLRVQDAHLQWSRDACIKSWMLGENKSNILDHKLSTIAMGTALMSLVTRESCKNEYNIL